MAFILGKHDGRELHVLVTVMGIFNIEDGDIMNLLPLLNVTSLGIMICMWLERLVALIKEEGKTNYPAVYDMEGYMLSTAAI